MNNQYRLNPYIPKKELYKYIGKYLLRENREYKWIFKLVDVLGGNSILVTQGVDIYPTPRMYHSGGITIFNKTWDETPNEDVLTRLPTKKEMNQYRQYTRELIFLGSNKSSYGKK